MSIFWAEGVLTPWQEGYEAGEKGKSVNDNPYSLENDDHGRWYQGWATAVRNGALERAPFGRI